MHFDWSVNGCRLAAEAGDVEAWVHDYLRHSPGPNLPLSDGLKLCRRWWLGPISVPMTDFVRVCGPEPGMEYPVSEEGWNAKVNGLAAAFDDVTKVPPFISEYRRGQLSLRDGSHRHEALRRVGVRRFWTLIWFNTEADYDEGRRAFEASEVKPTLPRDEVLAVLENLGGDDLGELTPAPTGDTHETEAAANGGTSEAETAPARGISDLTPIPGGQISQTFSFRCDGHPRIVRFATTRSRTGFAKELYVAARFGSPALPVGRILHVGTHRNLCFAISERIPGKTLRDLSQTERDRVLPQLTEILHAIRTADVSDGSGYGLFDEHGRGFSSSWSGHLAGIRDEEDPSDFYGRWHALFDETFLERDLFQRIYETMLGLMGACPEERRLVHGNLGYGNILVDEGRITGVIDWADARFGDFLFDVAGLDFWHRGDGHAARFRASCEERGVGIPRYDERIAACQCAVALDALRFFARTDQRRSYDWVREEFLGRTNLCSSFGDTSTSQ